MNRKAVILFSLIFSLCATFLLWKRVTKREEKIAESLRTVDIVVAGSDLSAGDILTVNNLRSLSIPEKAFSKRMIRSDEFSIIEGGVCSHRIEKGAPLVWEDIREPIELSRFSKTISPGLRAVTISADEKMIFSGMLKPGDRVDIIHLKTSRNGETKPYLLMRNILVSAINGRFSEGDFRENEGGTITFILTEQQAALLLKVAEDPISKLSLVLRNPGEKEKPKQRAITLRRIELYSMGKLEKTYTFKKKVEKKEKKR